jgi:hypothetical protein
VRTWLVAGLLAVPGVTLAQAGMGTGGTRSGNYTGGVSSINMPRDPVNQGREQMTREPAMAGQFDAALKKSTHDPDSIRAGDAVRPEEGVRAHGSLHGPR